MKVSEAMFVSVIIPAAGVGSRMNSDKKKQFIELQGRPILDYTLTVFQEHDHVDEIILVTTSDEIEYCTKEIVEKGDYHKVSQVIVGGSTRQESVHKGLAVVNPLAEYVLVHDGVRPFIEGYLIDELLKEVVHHQAVILGVPVKDTIKRVSNEGIVEETPERARLYAVQTPQAFNKSELEKVHREAEEKDYLGTDDASLIEEFSQQPVKVIMGSYNNIKVTTPEDLIFGERILNKKS